MKKKYLKVTPLRISEGTEGRQTKTDKPQRIIVSAADMFPKSIRGNPMCKHNPNKRDHRLTEKRQSEERNYTETFNKEESNTQEEEQIIIKDRNERATGNHPNVTIDSPRRGKAKNETTQKPLTRKNQTQKKKSKYL